MPINLGPCIDIDVTSVLRSGFAVLTVKKLGRSICGSDSLTSMDAKIYSADEFYALQCFFNKIFFCCCLYLREAERGNYLPF